MLVFRNFLRIGVRLSGRFFCYCHWRRLSPCAKCRKKKGRNCRSRADAGPSPRPIVVAVTGARADLVIGREQPGYGLLRPGAFIKVTPARAPGGGRPQGRVAKELA